MPDRQSKDEYGFYTCGRCKGKILYLKNEGRPDVCSECGYWHGTRPVNDIPREVKLSLNNLAEESDGSRGITEQTTITSR
jgi:DNA-directed RNA polymerase subunit RPC12/RpoP